VAPSLSYSWRANGLLVGGANTNIYIIEASDAGKSLTCVVNALFVRGSAGTVTNYRGTAVSVPVSIGQPTTTTPTAPTTAPTAATVIRRVALAILVMPRAVTRTVGASGRLAVVSRVTCAGGCTVSVTAKIRIGRKNFRAELARTIATKGQALTLVLPRAARAALRRVKQGRANVLVTVRGKQGGLGTLTQVLKLRSA
jgi:hypothetical protein